MGRQQHPTCATPCLCSALPARNQRRGTACVCVRVACVRLSRYHSTKHPDVNLCPEAFAKGLFPPGSSSKDFVRIEHRSQVRAHDYERGEWKFSHRAWCGLSTGAWLCVVYVSACVSCV